MTKNKLISNLLLLPTSKIYGLGVGIRNLMFKWRILKQREFDVPVVVVGNLAVGGTGKTPHVEYILELLKFKYHIGMISRGYKRKTKGFVLATRRSTPLDIGDEPYQIYQKFGRDITVAVCEDRCAGIEELLRIDPKINLIVLDDAFQHRYVKPTVSIVLTDFNAPVFSDSLLPHGRLREPMGAIYRADMVVVTKCPERLKAIEYRIFKNSLKLFPYQGLFFSAIEYSPLQPLFPDEALQPPYLSWLTEADSILALSGIANPKPFVRYLRGFHAKVKVKQYPDHLHPPRPRQPAETLQRDGGGAQAAHHHGERRRAPDQQSLLPPGAERLRLLPAGQSEIRPPQCRHLRRRAAETAAQLHKIIP